MRAMRAVVLVLAALAAVVPAAVGREGASVERLPLNAESIQEALDMFTSELQSTSLQAQKSGRSLKTISEDVELLADVVGTQWPSFLPVKFKTANVYIPGRDTVKLTEKKLKDYFQSESLSNIRQEAASRLEDLADDIAEKEAESCTDNNMKPSAKINPNCVGPVISLTFNPIVCELDVTNKQAICTPASLTLTHTPAACTLHGKTGAKWTSKACAHTKLIGVSAEVTIGGDSRNVSLDVHKFFEPPPAPVPAPAPAPGPASEYDSAAQGLVDALYYTPPPTEGVQSDSLPDPSVPGAASDPSSTNRALGELPVIPSLDLNLHKHGNKPGPPSSPAPEITDEPDEPDYWAPDEEFIEFKEMLEEKKRKLEEEKKLKLEEEKKKAEEAKEKLQAAKDKLEEEKGLKVEGVKDKVQAAKDKLQAAKDKLEEEAKLKAEEVKDKLQEAKDKLEGVKDKLKSIL